MKWEMYHDESYYGMWAVRPVGDRDFESPRLFHFAKEEDALKFKEAVEKAIGLSEYVEKAWESFDGTVEGLNRRQQSGIVHPYTCGDSDCRAVLIATEDGWVCPDCDYTQKYRNEN